MILTLLFTWKLFFKWLVASLSLLSTTSFMVSHARFQPHIWKRSTKQILTKHKSYNTTKKISQIWMLQLTYIKESNHSTSLILLTTAQRERERVSVWIEINATFSFPRFFFFFLFLCMNSNLAWVHCLHTVYHCLYTVYILKNIKNGSHGIINTFKNYFATVLSVFSF